ncbi:MAG: MiaB/RimO family radical SAM methylthiotransferase [Gammaproteobacteria bacterium]|nr:MiaB/RimO family radical SAM methylthiotransferase [Gammaproteobacteria bacterium]
MKFYIRTIGCKLNQLDSARVTAALCAAGHELAAREEEAEMVVVNSCTVTANSDRKSRQAANGAVRRGVETVVMGCGPRARPGPWAAALPHSRVFEEEEDLLAHFGADPESAPFPVTSRTRLPVAIQNGCDDLCSFCITRIARRAHRSVPAATVVAHVRSAVAAGVGEVVLTGVNLAAWGAGHTRRPREARLHELLAAILEDTEVPRVRVSSCGPQYLHDEFFDVLADPRICDHLHLSVQSGSPAVLARMERGHDAATVHRVAAAARRVRPDVALTADFIVGFPGETQAEFEETLAMVRDIGFAKLHVFPFSPREGTTAASLADDVPPAEKKRRSAALRAAGQALRRDFIAAQLGRTRQVLVEEDGTGFTGNYVRLRAPGAAEGALRDVRLTEDTLADRW